MCCIFTWLAWCFDASHRLVVFIMACLISTSFCCLLLTASLAGVAMGYNYSLAEYIDLKETNISVYIKRGVYDDEISDDFDWRRSGKEAGDISPQESTGLRSGGQPKMEGKKQESIFESEGENKYEGSLMRLTSANPSLDLRRYQPEPPYTTPRTTTNVVDGLLAVADNLPGGSKDRLRAIQAAARYHEAKKVELATAKIPEDASARVKAIQENAQIHDARRMEEPSTTDKYAKYFNQLGHHPGFPGSDVAARRFEEAQMKDLDINTQSYKFRDAVFGGQLAGWPTRTPSRSTTPNFFEYEMSLDPSLSTPGAVLPLQPGRRTFEDTQQSDYDDSGLPSRKKRSDYLDVEPNLLDNFNFLNTKLDANIHNQLDKPVNKELEDINADGNDFLQTEPYTRVKRIQETATKFDLDGKNEKIHQYDANEHNGNVMFNEFVRKYLEDLTVFGDIERKNVVPKKRRRSMGFEYKKRGNKQAKSLWWRIVNGAQQQWSRVIMYEDKLVSQIADMTSLLKQQLNRKLVT